MNQLTVDHSSVGLATALGAGLLIGIERERRKGRGAGRAFAGVRTFAIAAFAGALSMLVPSTVIPALTLFAVAAFALASYWINRTDDPGVTTELALVATVLVGMLAMSKPALAAGATVVMVALLFLRTTVQHFAVEVLSEREFTDAIILSALALILLPLLPDRPIAEAVPINPHRVVRLVVLMSVIQAFGYIMLRLVGPRVGVPIAGLMAGFVSSTATHAAMGSRARANPAHTGAYVSAAVFSNVATALQALAIVAATAPAALLLLAPYLFAMGLAALVCGAVTFRRITESDHQPEHRAFNLRQAFMFAMLLTAVSWLAQWVDHVWGDTAAWAMSILAAMVDVHVAVASLLAQPSTEGGALVVPALICLTVNAVMKGVASVSAAGPSRFTLEVGACLLLIAAAPWILLLFRMG